MGKQVLLVGATGLVGQGVLQVLLEASDITGVTVLVRRPYTAPHPKVRVLQVPGFTQEALGRLDLHGHDACLYCAGPLPLGMTEAAYREATVATLARVVEAYAAANPGGFVAYVSGMGADAGSRVMPLRVKGEAEAVLARSGLAYTCLRPGIVRPVCGVRSPHPLRRVLYWLGSPVLALAQHGLPRLMTSTRAVGECMLRLLRMDGPKPEVIENADIH
ncbi:NAD(P)H-binding protein [Thermomonas hydrothermalis]|uniref:NAD(P)H-binding n=1 Tax=Thermomonas hydrothermalis TaxID=213588 RepID=A0A1M4XTC0_9GAMM|nr:NAD(P)H-binding protein [Thermomonas hydrothermalis]SHE96817.1 NAD(P)H-binding [Thermomonas hydrothermalis]